MYIKPRFLINRFHFIKLFYILWMDREHFLNVIHNASIHAFAIVTMLLKQQLSVEHVKP